MDRPQRQGRDISRNWLQLTDGGIKLGLAPALGVTVAIALPASCCCQPEAKQLM